MQAVKPTEKAFRPSHRAAIHSAILNDVSYFSIIEVRGRQNAIILMLRNICDPQLLVSSKRSVILLILKLYFLTRVGRYIDGSRICYVHAYESGDYPYNLIGPISIIWKPVDLEWDGISSDGPGIADAATRAIWIRSHPAIYAQLHRAICNSVMHLGSVTQRSAQVDMELDNDKAFELEVADLRNDINVFEITGPRSSQVIAGALRLAKGVSARGRKFWTNLPNLHTPGSVPRGMVIGLRVHDPRLRSALPNVVASCYKVFLHSASVSLQRTLNQECQTLITAGIWKALLLTPRSLPTPYGIQKYAPRFKNLSLPSTA